MRKAWFEDFVTGDVHVFGSYTMAAEEILSFARQYDPQPFHIDEDAAARSVFGGIIASGWHTASACMRMIVDHFLGAGSGSLGSPGMDEIRWTRPVRPGDTLTVRAEVLEVKPSRSKPDRGAVQVRYVVLNQKGDGVMTMVGTGLFVRRSPSSSSAASGP